MLRTKAFTVESDSWTNLGEMILLTSVGGVQENGLNLPAQPIRLALLHSFRLSPPTLSCKHAVMLPSWVITVYLPDLLSAHFSNISKPKKDWDIKAIPVPAAGLANCTRLRLTNETLRKNSPWVYLMDSVCERPLWPRIALVGSVEWYFQKRVLATLEYGKCWFRNSGLATKLVRNFISFLTCPFNLFVYSPKCTAYIP